MLPLRTILKPNSYPFSIAYQDRFCLLGSCFTENIGEKLEAAKFKTTINSFGILYHPISILENLKRALEGTDLPKNTIFQQGELWYSHLHHSQFSASSEILLHQLIQEQDQVVRSHLQTCNRLIFSFGTAKIYEHKKWNGIVANCHKLPMNEFENRLLRPTEIVDHYVTFLNSLKTNNRDLQVLFTLSPVRHIRDGIVENQRSKAILLTAIHEICEQVEFSHYFPSYELLMDDLRDYRFYERDLLHPSSLAIDYIWEYFQQSLFDTATQQLYQQICSLQQAASHRPFHPDSAAHQAFLHQQLEKIKQFQQQYPFLDMKKEQSIFQRQLV